MVSFDKVGNTANNNIYLFNIYVLLIFFQGIPWQKIRTRTKWKRSSNAHQSYVISRYLLLLPNCCIIIKEIVLGLISEIEKKVKIKKKKVMHFCTWRLYVWHISFLWLIQGLRDKLYDREVRPFLLMARPSKSLCHLW